MRRVQGGFPPRDLDEERKRSRDSVIANLFIFGAFIGVIRSCKLPHVLAKFTHQSVLF